jgi:hypothetical protein
LEKVFLFISVLRAGKDLRAHVHPFPGIEVVELSLDLFFLAPKAALYSLPETVFAKLFVPCYTLDTLKGYLA